MFAFRTQSRRMRPVVWVMLFVWLFALALGAANACLPSGSGAARLEPMSQLPAAPSLRWVAQQHEDQAAPHHESEQNIAKDSCLKFCDDESSALWKSGTSALDPAVALGFAVDWRAAPVPAANAGTGLSLARPAAQGPPLVIRLLRLTL